MDPRDLIGQQLSILIMGEHDDDEEAWPVLTGIVEETEEGLRLSRPEGDFLLRPEWLPRIREVDPRVRGVLLGADYVLPIRVGDLPASATPKQIHDLTKSLRRRDS